MRTQIFFVVCILTAVGRQLPAQQSSGLSNRPVILYNCPIRPLYEVKVPSRVAGVIAEVYVKEGSIVKKGQKLAKLDDQLAVLEMQSKGAKATSDSAIKEALAAEEEAQAKVEDGIRLGPNISREEMRVRRAQLKVAQYRVDGAREEQQTAKIAEKSARTQVQFHEVVSPSDGVVVQQLKQNGESVQVLDPVFRVIRTDMVKVEAALNIRDADVVRKGTVIEVFPNKHTSESLTLRGHTAGVNAVRVLPDGKLCASAGSDGAIVIWNVSRGVRERVIAANSAPVFCLATTKADPKLVVSGGADKFIRAWDATTGDQIHSVPTNASAILSIALSPSDPNICATGHEDRLIRVWNLQSGELLYTLGGHTNYITSLSITPDGRHLLSASNDQTLRIWDLSADVQKRDVRTIRGRNADVRQVGISPDGKAYIFNSYGRLEVRGLADDAPIAAIEGDRFGFSGKFSSAAVFSPIPGLVLAADDNERSPQLQLWQLGAEDRHARQVRIFDGHADQITSVDFAPDGSYVASGCADRTVRLYRVDPIERINRERSRGKIEFINQQAEAGSQTLAVYAEVENKDLNLIPGGFATMVIYPGGTVTAKAGE